MLSVSDFWFRKKWLLPAMGALLAPAALSQELPSFSLPVSCAIGKSCVLQNYVDQDPGPGARDYRCGLLAYEGHKGTDIRVIDPQALRQGTAVIAAAPGRVRAVRDGMDDVSVRVAGKAALAGRDAGNSVAIEHGAEWETQYAHLRKGTVAVRPGETVERGQKLGMVGLSGNTEFPHLHFEVRYQGKTVDPFVGLERSDPCGLGKRPLWQPAALVALTYVETGLLDAGISGAPPVQDAGGVDREKTGTLNPGSAAAVFWIHVYGAQHGDIEHFRLLAPDGRVLADRRTPIARNYAQWLAYVGVKRRESGWQTGAYRGEYTLYRGSQERKILSLIREVRIETASAGRR